MYECIGVYTMYLCTALHMLGLNSSVTAMKKTAVENLRTATMLSLYIKKNLNKCAYSAELYYHHFKALN